MRAAGKALVLVVVEVVVPVVCIEPKTTHVAQATHLGDTCSAVLGGFWDVYDDITSLTK